MTRKQIKPAELRDGQKMEVVVADRTNSVNREMPFEQGMECHPTGFLKMDKGDSPSRPRQVRMIAELLEQDFVLSLKLA